MAKHDLVIRGGNLVDGSGADARTADIAIEGSRIVEVGDVSGSGHREIDAAGALVTPGFVDIHTHYDGQATWSNRMSPSAIMGLLPWSWVTAAWGSHRCDARITTC